MATPYVADPPRQVPNTTALAVLFGGFLTQFGFGWLAFSVPFVVAFVPLGSLLGGFNTDKYVATTGRVVEVRGTSSYENDVQIMAYRFEFQTPDGQRHEAESYYTGHDTLQQDQRATVLYDPSKPEKALLKGQRRDLFPAWVGAMVLIFPGVGMLLLYFGFRNRPRALRILRWGRYATGKLIGTEPTNVRINNRTVVKNIYEVALPNGTTFQAEARSHLPGKLQDEAQEPLLYLERLTGTGYDAQLLDELPGRPRFDTNGNLTPAPLGLAISVSILPLLLLLSLAAIAWYHLG